MILVTVFENKSGFCGFRVKGHSGYAQKGSDIICSAVSALTVNTVNSIETFTSDRFQVKQDEDGYLECRFENALSEESTLLMNSMILGLQSIQQEYGEKYIRLVIKEV